MKVFCVSNDKHWSRSKIMVSVIHFMRLIRTFTIIQIVLGSVQKLLQMNLS